MNIEMAKIREKKGYNDEINREPTRLKEYTLMRRITTLNTNLNCKKGDIDAYTNALIKNTYIILYMFNEMGIYPDYFYDEVVKLRVEQKSISKTEARIRINSRSEDSIDMHFSALISDSIREGLKNKRYRIKAYTPKGINDVCLEMLGFFEKFHLPYNIQDNETREKLYNELRYKQYSSLTRLLNSDYLSDDIEYLLNILYSYIKYFVSCGIYPKQYLDELIEKGVDVGDDIVYEENSDSKTK